jgi:ribonuclease-3
MVLFGRKPNPYRELERQLGYTFKNRALLEKALTHRSFRFERHGVEHDNQRLEFLGDAVLCLLTAAHMYARYEDKDEGFLTSLRSQMISGKALTERARLIDLGRYLRIGKGEDQSGGRQRASNLADALEAVIGAAYLDRGMKATEQIFKALFLPAATALNGDVWAINPKGRLQEMAQHRWHHAGAYRTVRQEGPAHDTVFTAEVCAGDTVLGEGQGSTKRDAEMAAARAALLKMAEMPPDGVAGQS